MNNIACHICGNENINYYRQKIKGGRIYITARCKNGHSPIKGKPFFEQWRFDIGTLPFLDEEEKPRQPSLFPVQPYRNYPFPVEEK